jgi:hypothetical protein
MFESQERIDILKCKILQHIENSTMDVSSELQIFEAIAKKYRMKTITNYGKAENISYNGVLDRIKRKHCASFRIDTVTFCCM